MKKKGQTNTPGDPSSYSREDWRRVVAGDPYYSDYYKDPYSYNPEYVASMASYKTSSLNQDYNYDHVLSEAQSTQKNLLAKYQEDYNNEENSAKRLMSAGINPALEGLDQASETSNSDAQSTTDPLIMSKRKNMNIDNLTKVVNTALSAADIKGKMLDNESKAIDNEAKLRQGAIDSIFQFGGEVTSSNKRLNRKRASIVQSIGDKPWFRRQLMANSGKLDESLIQGLEATGKYESGYIDKLLESEFEQLDASIAENQYRQVKAEADKIYQSNRNPSLQADAENTGYRESISNSERQIDYNMNYDGASAAAADMQNASLANEQRALVNEGTASDLSLKKQKNAIQKALEEELENNLKPLIERYNKVSTKRSGLINRKIIAKQIQNQIKAFRTAGGEDPESSVFKSAVAIAGAIIAKK
ncbi:hypothetical protein [Capybara microvirus Cap3_SP_437]|nr:hypothetical protein [Capybara microvirus Cap3_SP_437]